MNVQLAQKTIEVGSSAGSTTVEHESTVPGIGTTMFKKVVPNIMTLKETGKVGHLTYDSEKDDTFKVKLYKNGKKLRFGNDIEDLYTYRPTEKYIKEIRMRRKEKFPSN